jgi:hypothetical protein
MHRVTGGEEQHLRCLACPAQACQNLPAIQMGKHNVQDDHVKVRILRHPQPVQAICRYIDDEPRFSESLLQELGGFCFIFYDQNFHKQRCDVWAFRARIPVSLDL